MGTQYAFEKWDDGSTATSRNVTVTGPLILDASYKEVVQMTIVKISGNVDKQAQGAESVSISVLVPGATVPIAFLTLTDAQGNWALPDQTYRVAGKYTVNASIPKDSEYDGASASTTFDVTLASRTLTVKAVVV